MRPSLTFWILLAFLGIILFALIMPYSGFSHQSSIARVRAAQADINGRIKTALDAFKVDTGSYPKGRNGLFELVQQSRATTNWNGSYFDPPKWPVDPWGNKYFYEYPGKHNGSGYDLFSAGPDGKAGTDDDIVNW